MKAIDGFWIGCIVGLAGFAIMFFITRGEVIRKEPPKDYYDRLRYHDQVWEMYMESEEVA